MDKASPKQISAKTDSTRKSRLSDVLLKNPNSEKYKFEPCDGFSVAIKVADDESISKAESNLKLNVRPFPFEDD
jgi:hypothetical protein